MLGSGITPSEIDKQNYLEVLTIMKARPRDKRPLNAGDAHKKITQMFSN